jgi:hypothetical protein
MAQASHRSSRHSRELLHFVQVNPPLNRMSQLSVTAQNQNEPVAVNLRIRRDTEVYSATFEWPSAGGPRMRFCQADGPDVTQAPWQLTRDLNQQHPGVFRWLGRMQTFALDAKVIAESVQVSSGTLDAKGKGLAAVLDDLKDNHLEQWDSFLGEMRRWLPEYDQILFDNRVPVRKESCCGQGRGDTAFPRRSYRRALWSPSPC